jgi:hypothetical protein
MLEVLAMAIATILFMFLLRKRFYSLFFVILLITEFFYIQVLGGIARPYHFLAVIVVICLSRHIPLLFKSKVFLALMVFIGVNLCAINLSDSSETALASFLSLGANMAVAMSTALILLTGKVTIVSFKRIILTVTLISVLWGLLQIIAFHFAGVVLALSQEQLPQIQAGFGPAFRTEANTFGKYMVFPFLLFLPEYIEYRRIKHINLVFVIFLIGILMNFTRSSIYGMGIAFIFILIWYAQQDKLCLLTSKSLKFAAAIAVGVILILCGKLNVSEYTVHKIDNFFKQQEILEGGSSAYRLGMMQIVINGAMSNTKKMIVGNGWGQTHVYYGDTKVQAGGGDIVNILGYCGLLGTMAYFAFMLLSFTSARKNVQSSQDKERAYFSEGVMFALVGIFCTAQMSGYLISPEYWLLLGICIYLSLNKQTIQPLVQTRSN